MEVNTGAGNRGGLPDAANEEIINSQRDPHPRRCPYIQLVGIEVAQAITEIGS